MPSLPWPYRALGAAVVALSLLGCASGPITAELTRGPPAQSLVMSWESRLFRESRTITAPQPAGARTGHVRQRGLLGGAEHGVARTPGPAATLGRKGGGCPVAAVPPAPLRWTRLPEGGRGPAAMAPPRAIPGEAAGRPAST